MSLSHPGRDFCLFILTFLCAGLSTAAEQTPPRVPLEHFAALPVFSQAQLSPSGREIAYLTDLNGQPHLVVQKLDGSEQQIIPPGDRADIQSYHWASDERILIVYDVLDKARDIEMTRLVGINRTTQTDPKSLNFRYLIKPSGEISKSTKAFPLLEQDRIVSLLPDDLDHILIAVDADGDFFNEVRRVNVHTGKYREVEPRLKARTWLADYTHTPRVALGNPYADRYSIWLKNSQSRWQNLARIDWPEALVPIALAKNPDYIYATGVSEHDTIGVYLVNLLSGEIVEEVFVHEQVDIHDLRLHPETGVPVGVEYLLDFYEVHYFDEEMRRLQEALDTALPETRNWIVNKARSKPIYLVFSSSDREPGLYYWYDTEARRLYPISPTRNGIDPDAMARVQPVTYAARDGTPIPAYLTLPPGMEDARNLPTVILPHGGPHVRDSAHWDYLAQFLASRGYAVMQPNFRGSDGYGVSYQKAGENQWGGLMQDDVTDATHWMIEQGYADPARICIAGYSYGGYAALMGAIKEPDLYRCAVSGNGAINLSAMKKHISATGFKNPTIGLEGHRDKEVSPHHQSDRITIPVLLLASDDDGRVPYRQSEKMHKKLRSLGKDSTFVLMKGGGHNILTTRARLTLLSEMEKFLEKHLR